MKLSRDVLDGFDKCIRQTQQRKRRPDLSRVSLRLGDVEVARAVLDAAVAYAEAERGYFSTNRSAAFRIGQLRATRENLLALIEVREASE